MWPAPAMVCRLRFDSGAGAHVLHVAASCKPPVFMDKPVPFFKFAKKCSATGRGFNVGYVMHVEEFYPHYFCEEKYLVDFLRNHMEVDPENQFSDEAILAESYALGEYDHTEWIHVPEYGYYESQYADGIDAVWVSTI